MILYIFLGVLIELSSLYAAGLLFVQESPTRQLSDLSGLWDFVAEQDNTAGIGFGQSWASRRINTLKGHTVLPVPCAYNDVTESQFLRDHVGWVWYQRTFFVPPSAIKDTVILRFGSVNYYAAVFVNGKPVGNHTGGHIPFEYVINDVMFVDKANVLTVAVNNTIDHSTIPPGEFTYEHSSQKPGSYHLKYPPGFFKNSADFDFFPYAGILRPVYVWRMPKFHIDDVTVVTDFDRTRENGLLNVVLKTMGKPDSCVSYKLELLDKYGKLILSSKTKSLKFATLTVRNVNKWWPRKMHVDPGYLYDLTVSILKCDGSLIDKYSLSIGFRTVKVDGNKFLINDKPLYFHGTDMHEDSDIRGRGFDRAIMVKDLNLLEWLDGNAFRTSHYPYAEERYIEADRRGIVIIAETPAVGVRYFNDNNLALHKQYLIDMINRDKNHPSVVIWSMANEPKSAESGARSYFKALVDKSHSLDPTRPVTIVLAAQADAETTADLLDVVCLNRYFGWYINMGYTSLITDQLHEELREYNARWHKPMIVSEYGAGAVPGINMNPPVGFSESYQAQVMMLSHLAFDKLRSSFLIGELVWNLADFNTQQGTTRVVGNRKGLFTRQRQPKMAAYVVRNRYTNIDSNQTSCHNPFDVFTQKNIIY